MIMTFIIICILAFWVGFLSGKKGKKSTTNLKRRTEFMPIDEEYINFLNYDGSEQI